MLHHLFITILQKTYVYVFVEYALFTIYWLSFTQIIGSISSFPSIAKISFKLVFIIKLSTNDRFSATSVLFATFFFFGCQTIGAYFSSSPMIKIINPPCVPTDWQMRHFENLLSLHFLVF